MHFILFFFCFDSFIFLLNLINFFLLLSFHYKNLCKNIFIKKFDGDDQTQKKFNFLQCLDL